jgi:flagellin
MTVINTNNAATITANALSKNERAMSQAMERLSTGVRINSAGDDAAGLAISSRMTSQINGLNMAVRNANDAISMVQTEDGALIEVTNMLQRMRELAVQAASGTNSSTDRTALDTEFSALASQVQAIGSNTQWNGSDIIDGTPGTSGAVSFQIGANASQTVSHTFADIEVANAGNGDAHSATTATSGTSVSTLVFGGDTGDNGFATGDTVTFSVNSVAYSGKVTTVASGAITGITLHGASAETKSGASDATSIAATTLGAAGSGAITFAFSAANTFTLTTATSEAGVDLLSTALVTTFNDGVGTASRGSVTTGLTAGAVYADISTSAGADSALKTIDQILTDVNTARASSVATINRLEYAADNLANVSQNTSASRSRILDADYASETTELARTQIIQQAGTAMLSQANQQAQSVLALLK